MVALKGGECGGRMLVQESVWAVSVVMLGELFQYQREVVGPGDQKVVEAFAGAGCQSSLAAST
jgi:hypothetical protein